MLRLFANQGFNELWKCSHFVASFVTKRQVTSFLPVCSTGLIPARHFNTGIQVWNDAIQTKTDNTEDIHTVDVDKWKSVMRVQVASQEKQVNEDDEEVSDDQEIPSGGSSLEATRDLVAMWQLAGKFVPKEITDAELQALADLTTKSSRKKYLKYLAIKEGRKRSWKEKQQQKKADREALRQQDGDAEDWKKPALKNTMFLNLWGRTVDKHMAWNSARSMLFGQPLVFDMSYDSNMGRRELVNAVSQLMEAEGWNRRAIEPYHIHFCNLEANGAYKKELIRRYGAEAWEHLLITDSEKQHVDLFPREQLVYLTADSPNVLRKYDHDKVYIIGALVDRTIQKGVTLANAKRLNLATARLPLDEFLQWDIGAKTLTLDQMIRIMLCMKDTGKWDEALKFVPQRKHDGFHQELTEKSNANDKFTCQDAVRPLGSAKIERTFKNEGLFRSEKGFGFSGRDRKAGLSSDRAATRVRTSLRSNLEGGKIAGKGKMWWTDE
ncbi:tRNA methyltransferase 10 homolog C [Plectropomus leopardus]|uniref:tRNA methyltransferase 10 homolog C n=1 Tax=Plectropomus leopardus TaxID=160734 RepID=UPI001C4D71D5|nr:tRNA methyltransferase 10 homolog C [Plectropomus leopardus]